MIRMAFSFPETKASRINWLSMTYIGLPLKAWCWTPSALPPLAWLPKSTCKSFWTTSVRTTRTCLSCRPVDIVKLDKAYADDMLQPDWSDQKIAGISALIRSGNLRVIAEGVETAQQARILTDAGAQMAQGYFFSRPLRARKFISYWARHQQ